ncbi:MAG: hypothetical protein K8S54_12480 [Spirochaetia bacterium]|nr:hypothetical protein [Spirochaetia bacterium]
MAATIFMVMVSARKTLGAFVAASVLGAALCTPLCAAMSVQAARQHGAGHCQKTHSPENSKHCASHAPILLKNAEASTVLTPVVIAQAAFEFFERANVILVIATSIDPAPPDKTPVFIQFRSILV